MSYHVRAIGVIHSPFRTTAEAPHQGSGGRFEIEVYPEFAEGLRGLERRTHLSVLYWLHESRPEGEDVGETPLVQLTPWDETPRGVFATRSPRRPNPIGLSVVELLEVRGRTLVVSGLDAIEGTPVVDIKPHVRRLEP